MEKLKQKHENLHNALERLREVIDRIQEIDNEEGDWKICRDSMIKRFEFSIELFWKCVKRYIYVTGAIHVNSPKEVIRKACSMGFLLVDDAEIFLQMLGDRNLTSHMYKEELADRLCVKIPQYYMIMKKNADKIIHEER